MAETQHSKQAKATLESGLYLIPPESWRIHCPRAGCLHFVDAPTLEWAEAKLKAHLLSPVHVLTEVA